MTVRWKATYRLDFNLSGHKLAPDHRDGFRRGWEGIREGHGRLTSIGGRFSAMSHRCFLPGLTLKSAGSSERKDQA